MSKKKLISKDMVNILLSLDEERLKSICAVLMHNVIFLTMKDVLELKNADDKNFEEILFKIKQKIENDNIDTQIKQLQYTLCKLIGYLEFKAGDRKKGEYYQDEIYDIILTDVLYPLSEWLKDKAKENKIARTCYNILKNEIFCT